MRVIYLDGAATTPPRKEALEALNDAALLGNPSSLHGAGRAAAELLERSRRVVSEALGCKTEELIFTSGGTEANALAIMGTAGLARSPGHIITTALEHPAVLNQVKRLMSQGWSATIVKPSKDGRVNAGDITDAVKQDTRLVSCMAVCNETGAALPVSEIAAAVKSKNPNTLIHSDGVQAFLKLESRASGWGADMVSVSAHKVGGLRGVGALCVRNGVRLEPLWCGGGQEKGLRPGTEPLPLIAAFAAAVEATEPRETEKLRGLVTYAKSLLTSSFPKLVIIPPHDAPHILTFAMPGAPAQVVQRMLSDLGIYVSTGSACGRGRVSPVLKAMGLPKPVVEGAVRVSVHPGNANADIDALCDALAGVYERLGILSGAGQQSVADLHQRQHAGAQDAPQSRVQQTDLPPKL